MIADLNRLVELVEDPLEDDLDVTALASEVGTTEYHLPACFRRWPGLSSRAYAVVP